MIGGLTGKIISLLPENNQLERIWIIAKTDYKIKYYDTFLGMIWAMIMPLVRLLIYWLVFSNIFDKKIDNYGLYIYSGLLLWMFFQQGTKKGITALRSKRYLMMNIKVRKLDIFISSLLASFLAFLSNFVVYLLFCMFFDLPWSWNVLYMPIMILNVCILVFGVMLILSTLHIFMRDISQIWDMVLLAWFWINPIFFAKAIIFETFPFLLYVNPLAGIIINFRSTIMDGKPPDWYIVAYDYAYAFVLLGIGLMLINKFYHKAAEKL
ncbi:MAG: ABC transporter permease [Bacteroidetes bacterium]|nr:ABC transporter permease [Bacteroidota bacterium]